MLQQGPSYTQEGRENKEKGLQFSRRAHLRAAGLRWVLLRLVPPHLGSLPKGLSLPTTQECPRRQSRRDCALQPRVASLRATLGNRANLVSTPTGLRPR